MNKTLIHNLKFFSLSIALGIALGGGLIAVNAWTDAPPNPPAGNLGAPINTSTNPQTKTGGLVASGVGSSNYNFYFGNNLTAPAYARLFGDNGSAITFQSNSEIASQLLMRNKNGVTYGRVYGATGSDASYNFGLLNTDGQWSYLDKDDVATYFYRSGQRKMTILENGNVGIGTETPTYKLHVAGGDMLVTQKAIMADARVTNLANCDTIDTDASGNLKCGTDATGGINSSSCYNVTAQNDNWAACGAGYAVNAVMADGANCGGECVTTVVRCCQIY